MEPDRRLNRWALTFTPAVTNQLRKHAIFGQPQLSLEHQGKAKRYVVRGVESGGATKEIGYYVTFAGENGGPLAWLQTVDSLAVNGPHAIVIAPALTQDRDASGSRRSYELCITRHWPVTIEDTATAKACRGRTLSRRTRLSCLRTLGQRPGPKWLCKAAILYAFRRGSRIASSDSMKQLRPQRVG